jgi:hypothetical protein
MMAVRMNRIASGAVRYARRGWMIRWIAAGILVSVPVVDACEWSYLILGIRSKPADPLFPFVRNGKAGYIDSSGKIVIQPTLMNYWNDLGEFHEGLLAVHEEHGYRYLDRTGTVVFRSDAWLAFNFSEGLDPYLGLH